MIGTIALWLIRKGISPKLAKPLIWAVMILALLAALAILKSCYDSSVVRHARESENAKAIEGKAKADVKAGEQRGQDQARQQTESAQIKEAVEDAKAHGRDPRAAYYECVRLQQAARAAGRAAPSHC